MNNIDRYYNSKIADSCYYGKEIVDTLFKNGYMVYEKPIQYPMSTKKLESLQRIGQLRNYYLQNPVRFISDFFNIELLDAQAYMLMSAWNCPNVLLLCSRGIGKSTFSDLLIMAKQMLSQSWVYIASGSGSQAEQTFTTLERIANDRIDSMVGSTGYIFKDEIEIKNNGDGFSHSSNGYTYNLYNGSFTQTLNSNINKKRGKRGNIVLFDECGWLDEDLLETYKAFTVVDKNFKTGYIDGEMIDKVNLMSMPNDIPNQLIYISSASSIDTEFAKLYRDFSKKMLIGDPNYFVAHIDCEVAFKPTMHNKLMPPLLTPEIVKAAMRTNPEKGRREYYCQFTRDAGVKAIIRRGVITRNEEVRKPVLYNDTGDRKVVIAYDPARSRDNSVILVCEIYEDLDYNGEPEYKMRLLNCINLVDVERKLKKPMRTPEQVEYLKNVILDYNQGGDESYSNILGVYIDAGSGGAGVNIADYLMPDWTDSSGRVHRGLIDAEASEEYLENFPNAVDKVRLIQPGKYKSVMYNAAIELTDMDKVSFTAEYDERGYLTMLDIDRDVEKEISKRVRSENKNLPEDEIQDRIDEELKKVQNVKARVEKLDWQEEIALSSIDALKEELVNIVRIKNQTNDSFELIPEKRGQLNDDRAYVYVMCCYALMQMRRKKYTDRKPDLSRSNIADVLASQTRKSSRKYKMFD